MAEETQRQRLNRIIFGTAPGVGRNFDIVLIVMILASVIALFMDSVATIHQQYGHWLYAAEIGFTLLFTLEYIARVYCAQDRKLYITSFYGVVDFLAILPTYLSFIVPGAQHLLIIRIFRVLRVFRVLKLFQYMSEANVLVRSLMAARRKIAVFLVTVITLVIVFGALMYLVEGPERGFTSLPQSIYWAIVTVTTVGYGDIVPQTALGQAVAAMAMITSYAIIAIPTGIVSAELIVENQRRASRRRCVSCNRLGHDGDAYFCKHCGDTLPEEWDG